MELSSSGGLGEASLLRRRRPLRMASDMPGSLTLGRDVAVGWWPSAEMGVGWSFSMPGDSLLGLRLFGMSEVSGVWPASLSARSLSTGILGETSLSSPENAGG